MTVRLEILNEREFQAALDRLVDEVEDRTVDGVRSGFNAIEREFYRRARKLSGEYSRSLTQRPVIRGRGTASVDFLPDVPYAGKQERRNHTLEESMRSSERAVGNALEEQWSKAVR